MLWVHLHAFCERLRRDTAPISKTRFAYLVQELWPYQERMGRDSQLGEISLFEFMTAMAFWCFSEDRVARSRADLECRAAPQNHRGVGSTGALGSRQNQRLVEL